MRISGKIISGARKAVAFVCNEIYSKEFTRLLGFTPFPGTLNIEISKKNLQEINKIREKIKTKNPEKFLEIKGFEFEGKKFISVKLVKAKIFLQEAGIKNPVDAKNSVPCAVVFPQKTLHPENIIEVIAAENLREEFGLNEGDIVSVEIV